MLIPKSIAAIESIAAQEKTRYAIDSVLLERDEKDMARAIATDGRRLIFVEWNEADAAKFPAIEGFDSAHKPKLHLILSPGALNNAAKTAGASQDSKTILNNIAVGEQVENGQVVIATTDGETCTVATTPKAKAKFPKWREVIPKYKPLTEKEHDEKRSIRIGVGAKLLAELLEAFCTINKDEDNGMAVTLEVPLSPTRPIIIHSNHHGESKTTAVLMPAAIL